MTNLSYGRRVARHQACASAALSAAAATTLLAQTPPSGGYNLHTLGLRGALYQYSTPTGIGRNDAARRMNMSGQVIGTSALYVTSNGTSSGVDAWLYDGATTRAIGLTGPGYEVSAPDVIIRSNFANLLNEAGEVAGNSERINSAGKKTGSDVWLYSGGATQVIGLTGSGYEYPYTGSGGGTYRNDTVQQLNNSGQALGSADRYSAAGAVLGTDAWVGNVAGAQAIGLAGTDYDYLVAGGTFHSISTQQLNDAGQAIGFTTRRNPSGIFMGQDAWRYDSSNSATTLLGLTGSGYENTFTGTGGGTYRFGSPLQINAGGQVIGYTQRRPAGSFSYPPDASDPTQGSLGQDAWFYNGASMQVIGLTGSGYENAVTGGTYRFSAPQQLNTSGKVAGYSSRRSASGADLGQDAWRFDGASTQLIGLTGTNYEYANASGTTRNNVVKQMNAAGQVVGTAVRYNSLGATLGQDSWFFDGTTVKQVNLTGGVNETPYTRAGGGIIRYSGVTQINAAGQAIGFSERYDSSGNSNGRYGWFYDSGTGVTSALRFSFPPVGFEAETSPTALTDTGVVLGTFNDYTAPRDVRQHAFWWDLADGFHDLGTLVNGGLTAAQWDFLAMVYDSTVPGAASVSTSGSPQYIVGVGRMIGESDYDGTTSGESVYLLSANAPEPATLTGAALCAAVLFTRRRRSTSY